MVIYCSIQKPNNSDLYNTIEKLIGSKMFKVAKFKVKNQGMSEMVLNAQFYKNLIKKNIISIYS